MNSLSKRERTLLYVLLCFLIVMAGWFFAVTPMLDSLSTASSQLQEAQTTLANKQVELSNYTNATENLKLKQETYNALANKYYSTMSNDRIDALITKAILVAGLDPTSLTIGDVTPVTSTVSTQETQTEATTTTENTNTESTQSQQANGTILNAYQSEISISFTGTQANFYKMINSINEMKSVHVNSISYSYSDQAQSGSLSLVIFMINK